MRPRPFGRGNENFLLEMYPIQINLQCGHVLSVVEMSALKKAYGDLPWPSMRPRPFGRGNTHRAAERDAAGPAFNAATSFRSWKLEMTYQEAMRLPDLQCGHVLSVVEIP